MPPPIGSVVWFYEQYDYGRSCGIPLEVNHISFQYAERTCMVYVEPIFEDIENAASFGKELGSILNKHWFEYKELTPWLNGKVVEMPTKYKNDAA